MDIKEAGEKLRISAERIDASQPVELKELLPGRAFAQGDVGVAALERLPQGATQEAMPPTGQVAPGTSKGSRHCIARQDHRHVTVYRLSDGDPLSDLCLIAKEKWTLEHPDHGNVTFPSGCYRIHHQQNETFERVRD